MSEQITPSDMATMVAKEHNLTGYEEEHELLSSPKPETPAESGLRDMTNDMEALSVNPNTLSQGAVEEQSVGTHTYYSKDTWEQHDEQGQPIASSASSTFSKESEDSHTTLPPPTSSSLPETKATTFGQDGDTSHAKGFYNTSDMSDIRSLKVEGKIPEWLTGEHFTVGPGTYEVKYTRKIEIDGFLQSATGTFSFGHWFDGLPLVNRFDYNGEQNTIAYRNRLTCRRMIEKIRDHHGYAPCHPAGLFKTDSNQTVLIKFIKTAPKANKPDGEPCQARILSSIPGVDGRLFCQNMANHIQELDPSDLKPVRVLTTDEINPMFKGYNSCPNPQLDLRTGEYINFTMEIGYSSTSYHFFSLSSQDTKGHIIASIHNAPTGYVNSFSLTDKYIILFVYPLLANSGAVKYAWNESIMDSFSFSSSEPTLIYLISREESKHVATYRTEPCFAFHHVNAFDHDQSVFVDILAYSDDTIAHQLTLENLRNPATMQPSQLAKSEIRRYRLHNIKEARSVFDTNNTMIPTTSSLTSRAFSLWEYMRGTQANNEAVLDDEESRAVAIGPSGWHSWIPLASYDKCLDYSIELPQINPFYKAHPYAFVYGIGFSEKSATSTGKFWDSIVKTNINTNTVAALWHEEYCYPSEALFIPRPSQEEKGEEDDGVLVSIVMNSKLGTSFLIILDAVTLNVLARADLETLVPLSFAHGSYRLQK